MKIMIVDGHAPSLVNTRGPLLKRLVEMGHEVHALAPHHIPDVRPQLEAMGVEYHIVPLQRRGLNIFADLGALLHLKQIVHRLNPQIVLSCGFKPSVYGSLAARMAWVDKKKSVYSLITGLGYAFLQDKGLKRRILFSVAKGMLSSGLGQTNGIIFQSVEDETFFKELGVVPKSKRAQVINGPGVDLDQYTQVPLPEPLSFLCLSRLTGVRGVREYGEAAIRLKELHPDVSFKLVGPVDIESGGIAPDELATWKEAGLEIVEGGVEDVRPEIGQASVCVTPTRLSGAVHSLLAALAMGRPVITTDVTGCRDCVNDGENGFLVKAGDTDALMTAMQKFIDDPALVSSMGASSRLLAESRFDAAKVVDELLEFMELTQDR